MKLYSKISGLRLTQPEVLRVAENHDRPLEARQHEVLITDDFTKGLTREFALVLRRSANASGDRILTLPEDMAYVQQGDILRFSPSGEVHVIYRRNSPHNSLLITERCNSKCVMCSQPPRDVDDDYLTDDWLRAIPLMSDETRELGITGGEPTLRFEKLLRILATAKTYLPSTSVHMLSNGRLFRYLTYAKRIAAIQHPDLMIGIPLYADVEDVHNYVVQAEGAFSQTILGILNVARVKQKVEIRFVIHQQTVPRLPHFARFVARNLPFVHHVALMGLELMGYARTNLDALWIDPVDYHAELIAAVDELSSAKLNVSIYNLPLCLLPTTLWPYARQSISDWKNVYFLECERCAVKDCCAGFFASSELRRSQHIRPLSAAEREQFLACTKAPETAFQCQRHFA